MNYLLTQKTRKYITKRAEEEKVGLSTNYIQELKSYCKLTLQKYNCKLNFNGKQCLNPESLNANAGWFKYSTITVTPEWAFKLASDESVKPIFEITLGHELSHKDRHISCFTHMPNFRFCTWINEIYADFGAAQKMCDSSREDLLSAMNYKMNYKLNRGKQDKETLSHPSWKRRISYVENYNFDEKLIKQIAKDTNCKNQRLIAKAIKTYPTIYLK